MRRIEPGGNVCSRVIGIQSIRYFAIHFLASWLATHNKIGQVNERGGILKRTGVCPHCVAGKRCVHDFLLPFDMLIQTRILEPFEILACGDAPRQLSDLAQPLDIACEQRMSRDTRQHLGVNAPPVGGY